MKKTIVNIFTICILLTAASTDVGAQCPMCKMSAESNLKSGGTAGKGLNTGILFMLSMPYLLVGGIGYIWWKNRRSETHHLD
jgi:hypothetical protein